MDDGDPNFTMCQTELVQRKGTSKERESAKPCTEQQEGLTWDLNVLLETDKAMTFWYYLLVTSFSFTDQQRHSLGAWELSPALTMQQFGAKM